MYSPRLHVSENFLIRNFFFPDTASVHMHFANSAAGESGYFLIRSPQRIR